MTQGYWYAASPYSNYPEGKAAACRDACFVTASLFKRNILVYSPIAHTHALAEAHSLPGDAAFWKAFDEALMLPALGLIVPEMPGWDKSVGVQSEIDFCLAHSKPVVRLTFPELTLRRMTTHTGTLSKLVIDTFAPIDAK